MKYMYTSKNDQSLLIENEVDLIYLSVRPWGRPSYKLLFVIYFKVTAMDPGLSASTLNLVYMQVGVKLCLCRILTQTLTILFNHKTDL